MVIFRKKYNLVRSAVKNERFVFTMRDASEINSRNEMKRIEMITTSVP